MSKFKKYRRTNIAEMREVTPEEIWQGKLPDEVSVSEADEKAGSPKAGDMIARNPDNHNDKWLVSAEYHEKNFELIDQCHD